ncbi:hypothetical protein JTB14_009448 [Gonioctena quinquepunctata]|nr:hypothetical protein JTB14_009448 [Gonioctena quinquepunctata]
MVYDRDQQWESNEHEEQIEQAEEMDMELGEESSVENGEFDDDNIPPSEAMEEDYSKEFVSLLGYLEKYLPEEFYENGAFHLLLMTTQQRNEANGQP